MNIPVVLYTGSARAAEVAELALAGPSARRPRLASSSRSSPRSWTSASRSGIPPVASAPPGKPRHQSDSSAGTRRWRQSRARSPGSLWPKTPAPIRRLRRRADFSGRWHVVHAVRPFEIGTARGQGDRNQEVLGGRVGFTAHGVGRLPLARGVRPVSHGGADPQGWRCVPVVRRPGEHLCTVLIVHRLGREPRVVTKTGQDRIDDFKHPGAGEHFPCHPELTCDPRAPVRWRRTLDASQSGLSSRSSRRPAAKTNGRGVSAAVPLSPTRLTSTPSCGRGLRTVMISGGLAVGWAAATTALPRR